MALTYRFGFFGTMASALNLCEGPAHENSPGAPVGCRKHIKQTKMKKIFTLALGLVLTAAVFAADKRPTMKVTAPKRFEIVIDGQHYRGNSSFDVPTSRG